MYCKISGIEPIGKTNPDKSNAGRNPIPIEIWLAKNWFFNTVEINKPIPIDANKNSELTKVKTK